jgi:hypothetical protein
MEWEWLKTGIGPLKDLLNFLTQESKTSVVMKKQLIRELRNNLNIFSNGFKNEVSADVIIDLLSNDAIKEGIKNIPKYAYVPFGGGNRMCIGEGFAWMEGVLVLAVVASRFRLELINDKDVEINPVFTLRTKQDVMMKAIAV